MSEPKSATALRELGEPRGPFLVVDPGRKTGFLCVASYGWYADTVPLEELPQALRANLVRDRHEAMFVVCEDYTLRGGVANNDPKVPSAQGIGMCRTACDWTDTPFYLVKPGDKRAGHMALDAIGRAAYGAAHNNHERDAVDIAGYVLREMRRKP